MLRHPTLDRLYELRLKGMAQALREQLEQPGLVADLSFEDRLGLLVDREGTERCNRRYQQRLKASGLPQRADLEDLDFSPKRGLERTSLLALADCAWVQQSASILITGPTGVGKSFLACALAHQACKREHRVLYARLPRLVQDLSLARADGRYLKLIASLAKMDVLILDDWGLAPMKAEHRRDLLEIMEDRYRRKSTIITSQFPIGKWHQLIGDPTLADAILDRILHSSYRFELKGESMRKLFSPLTPSKAKEP